MDFEKFVLDESILDTDAWLPKEALEEIVQAILRQEKMELNSLIECNPQYFTESSLENVRAESRGFVGYVESDKNNSTYKVQVKDIDRKSVV